MEGRVDMGIDMSIAFANPSSDNLVCYLYIPLHIAHFRPKTSKPIDKYSRLDLYEPLQYYSP
jgi:hypothetical protein